MSGYVPDPADATQPTDPIIAETAAAEFRALKARVNNLVAGNVQGTGIRSVIVNGTFENNQVRGNATFTPSGAGIQYVSDQWFYFTTTVGSLMTFNTLFPPTPPIGYRVAMECKVNVQRPNPAANEALVLEQPIEGFRMASFNYGTAAARVTTLLFWAYASTAGNYSVAIRNGGSNRSYVSTFNVAVINTWKRYAIVIPGDVLLSATNWPAEGTAIDASVTFDFGSGTGIETATPNVWTATGALRLAGSAKLLAQPVGNVLRIAGVEWKDGTWLDSSTPELIPYEVQLMQCARYYWSPTVTLLTAPAVTWISFPTAMRRQPVITATVGTGFAVASGGPQTIGVNQAGAAAASVIISDARLGIVA